MPKKDVIALSLDLDIIRSLETLSNGNRSQYANQLLREALGLLGEQEPVLTEKQVRLIVKEELIKFARTQGVEL